LKAEIFVMAMHSGQKGGNKSKKWFIQIMI
jgi:hypothetical protein